MGEGGFYVTKSTSFNKEYKYFALGLFIPIKFSKYIENISTDTERI